MPDYHVAITILLSLCLSFSHAKILTPFNLAPLTETNDLVLLCCCLRELLQESNFGAAPANPPPINAAVSIYHLDIPESISFSYSTGELASIELIIYSVDYRKVRDKEKRRTSTVDSMLLTYVGGKQQLMIFTEWFWKRCGNKLKALFVRNGGTCTNIHLYDNCHKELLTRQQGVKLVIKDLPPSKKSEIEKLFGKPGDVISPPTMKIPISEQLMTQAEFVMDEWNYTPEIETFFDWHRPVMAQLLKSNLLDSQYAGAAECSGLLLVGLGCGSGADLVVALKELRDSGFSTKQLGIEILSNLVSKGNQLYPELNIIQGDALNSAALIRAQKQKLQLPSSAPTLVLAEELLARRVLSGTYPALQVLQQLIQTGVADVVVIGGWNAILVDEDIAGAAGWSAQTVTLYWESEKFYLPALALVRPVHQEQMDAIRCRSIKRSQKGVFTTLDLSRFGLPLLALEYFLTQPEAQKFTQVGLSWSYLQTDTLDQLMSLLARFPNLKHVTISGFEPWSGEFLKKAKAVKQFKLFQRTDSLYANELPSLEPWRARLLGQYTTMPHNVLFDPKITTPPEVPHWTEDLTVSHLNPVVQAYSIQTVSSRLFIMHIWHCNSPQRTGSVFIMPLPVRWVLMRRSCKCRSLGGWKPAEAPSSTLPSQVSCLNSSCGKFRQEPGEISGLPCLLPDFIKEG